MNLAFQQMRQVRFANAFRLFAVPMLHLMLLRSLQHRQRNCAHQPDILRCLEMSLVSCGFSSIHGRTAHAPSR